TYIDDVEVSRNVVKETVLSEPRTRVISRGTNVPKASGNGTSTGGYIWPVVGSPGYNYISCRIWGYWGHTGTDIAARSGTPIVASMSGRVVKATQTRYGYGMHIIIQHDNGTQTLYAHCSALYVNVGDYVEQGQIIAAVGRTGNASGNHCHFEIRQNGSYLDATRFIGTRSPY
ncbi:peptidoglycan DD-metalloendopeptidase family protein, partial [Ligaoa zhengdingensis]